MKSVLFFILGCIPFRIFLVYLSTVIPPTKLKFFSIILLMIGLSFLYLYFTNKRLNAPEANGNTWWSKLRLMHGFFYLAAFIYAFQESQLVWIPLLIDVLFGFSVFLLHQNLKI